MAVVASIKNFHHYLYGRSFLVRSDHGSLRWLFNFKNPEGQLARWLETLATYDFKIEHRAGRIHSNADALSRRPCCETGCNYCLRAESKYEYTCKFSLDTVDISKQIDSPGNLSEIPVVDESKSKNNLSVCAVTRSQTKKGDNSEIPGSSGISTKLTGETNFEKDISLSDEQRQDPIIGQLFKWKLDGHRPEWPDVSAGTVELKHYWSKWDSIVMKNNILYQKWENDTGSRIVWQVLFPAILRKTALEYLHNAPSSGHLGIKKTFQTKR